MNGGSIRHDVWSFRAHLVGLLHRRCRLLLVHLVSLLLRTSTTVPCSEVDLSFTHSLQILPRRGAPHAGDQCPRTAAPCRTLPSSPTSPPPWILLCLSFLPEKSKPRHDLGALPASHGGPPPAARTSPAAPDPSFSRARWIPPPPFCTEQMRRPQPLEQPR